MFSATLAFLFKWLWGYILQRIVKSTLHSLLVHGVQYNEIMKNTYKLIPIILLILLGSCIPTVEVDEPMVVEKIEISAMQRNLMVGEAAQIDWVYKNEFGLEAVLTPDWINSNMAVVSVEEGKVTALTDGQAKVKASFIGVDGEQIESNELLFRVLTEMTDLANVTILSDISLLAVGDSLQLIYMAKDGNNEDYEGTTYAWTSSNASVASVSNQGLVEAVMDGSTSIVLTIDGVESEPYVVNVGMLGDIRTGEFEDADYSAKGAVTLEEISGAVILKFDSNFQTELLVGTWVFMANSIQGGVVKSSGLAVENISENLSGAQSFDLSALDSEIGLDSYKYVVILCEPFGKTMAFAELK